MRASGSLGADVPVIGVCKTPLASEEDEAKSQQNGWPPSTTGIRPFLNDYFNCPQTALYADEGRETYELLGNRTLQMPWRKILTRPWAAWRDLQAINQRMADKAIEPQSGGEGALLGGVCVIGPSDRGEPSFVYRELIGAPIPADDIEAAIREARLLPP
jgi:hypothetical protein